MTLIGRVLSWIDALLGTSLEHNYENFYISYRKSTDYQRGNKIQSILWIVALITFYAVSNNVFSINSFVPQESAALLVVIIGIFALSLQIFVFPFAHWLKAAPFHYSTSWHPESTKPQVVKNSLDDLLRIDRRRAVNIVVVFELPGRVQCVDIKLVSSNPDVEFSVGSELVGGLKSYPDGDGFYLDQEVEDVLLTPTLEVDKTSRIGSGPNAELQIIDVSDLSSEPPAKPSSEEAQKKGVELLKFEVTD